LVLLNGKKTGTKSGVKLIISCLSNSYIFFSIIPKKNKGEKKMLFIDYLPAELKAYKSEWFVSYHVKNPQTGKLHRKKIKLNRIKSIAERKILAKKLIVEINAKLAIGWNPFLEQEAPKAYTKLIAALDTFIKSKTKEFKSKDSIRTYKSHVEILKDYILNVINEPDLLVISFDNRYARNYMDYLYNEKDISGRTFNNYKTFATTFWNWFIEHLYCKVNPFLTVRKKQEDIKTRQIIDIETRERIKKHLLRLESYQYLAIVMLCYRGLIRPKEICLLKPKYINLKERIIYLPAKITKDKDDRIVSISSELMESLNYLKIDKLDQECYIFGKHFKPGYEMNDPREISREWSKMRDELNLPKEYQFYSLKDTGIVQLIRDGVDLLQVRDQAGHSSLEQTNQYAKYANPKGSDSIKKL
jgi:integrase